MSKELTIPVYNQTGEIKKNLALASNIAQIKPNERLLAQAIYVYQTNKRQGTVATRTRSQVRGSTRKIYRQKGTGRARHGDIKAPIFVGGGVAHGPQPKNYTLKLNKKQRRKALLYALNLKAAAKSILVLDSEISHISPKTKVFLAFLKKLKLEDKKILLVFKDKAPQNLVYATANLSQVNLISTHSLNPYELLRHEVILFLEEALTVFLGSDKNEN
jgi:large subunit ribosomal protein L4